MSDVTLNSVGALFQEWRETRSSRAELIPSKLWDLAVSLYPKYKRSKICRHLGLCAGKFRQHLIQADKISGTNGFVLANADIPAPTPQCIPNIQLTIQGHERSLNVCVGVDMLEQVLPHFKALL